MKGKGRRVAIVAACLAAATVAGTGVALRDRIQEEWYLWRLERGSDREKDRAATHLGRLRSVKAVPAILKEMRRLVVSDRSSLDLAEFFRAVDAIGRPAIPQLLDELEAFDSSQIGFFCFVAEEIDHICGYGLKDYFRFNSVFYRDPKPVLKMLSEDLEETAPVRRRAAEVLKKICETWPGNARPP